MRVFFRVAVLAPFGFVVARVFAAGRFFFALAARRGAGFLAVTRFPAFFAGLVVDFLVVLLVALRTAVLAFLFDPLAGRFPVARAATRFFLRGVLLVRDAVRDRDVFELAFLFFFTTHILRKSGDSPPRFRLLARSIQHCQMESCPRNS